MEHTMLAVLCVLVSQVAGVMAYNSDIIGIAVAGCISFFLLSVVIAIIIVSFSWSEWFNNWMKQKGKVRMPRAYFKRKEEIKKKLIAESVASQATNSVANGKLPAQSVDRGGQRVENQQTTQQQLTIQQQQQLLQQQQLQQQQQQQQQNASQQQIVVQKHHQHNGHAHSTNVQSGNSTSWVQGWNQRTTAYPNKLYEEKDVTMELGEEGDEEFRIETVLVDNEVLDVGPFKNDHSKEVVIKGDVYNEPYIYSTIDTAKKASFKSGQNVEGVSTSITTTSTEFVTSTEMREVESSSSIQNTRANEALVQL